MKKEEEKKPHVKKPLNAFMLYMKEMRAKVVAECTLKESAAINQILGRKVRSTPVFQAVQLSVPHAHHSVLAGPLSTVAQPVPRRTGQVLRIGPEGAAASFTALPDLVSPGQLRTCPLRHQGQPPSEDLGEKEADSSDRGPLRPGRSLYFSRNEEDTLILRKATRTWFWCPKDRLKFVPVPLQVGHACLLSHFSCVRLFATL